MVTVIVGTGEEEVKYMVHKNILCKCPFFKKCLSSGMGEQIESTVKLPVDDSDTLDVAINWLYQ